MAQGTLSRSKEVQATMTSTVKPKLQRVAGKTKEVSRRLFSTTSAGKRQDKLQDVARDGGLATQALKEDPAFNPHLLDTKQRHKKDLAAKVQENLQTAAASILHPKRGAKGKAARSTAGRLSRVERPYISQNMDIEFLEAHDNLSQAQSDALSGKNTLDEEAGSATGDCRERVEHLEAQRESIRAAHTMRRHVQRVRVVPKRHINLPAEDCFVERDDNGQRVRYDWLKWLGYNLLYHTQDFSGQYIDDFDELPFDIGSLQLQVERLAIASAPWQAFFMDMRSVYRWEDPWNTAKWLAVYICLWYTQYLMGFVYGYIIYIVIKNRFFPSSVEALRNSMHRTHHERGQACNFGELVDKYGRKHWLEPLLDELGPFMQLQLNDMANMLEYLRRNAQTTRHAAERAYVKEKDGHCASPYRGLFESVPDITLDETGSDEDDDWQSVRSTVSIRDGSDIVSYKAFSQGVVGRLIIYSSGVRFLRSIKQKEIWRHSFLELAEMRKQDGSVVSKLPTVSSQSLELKFIDGSKIVLEAMRERDGAFSSIIGLSGLQWQSLQAKTINADSSFSL
ncbi:MAG: hypothetical protein L6R40_003783 [Gallowayella cf. fulva]|nr:MAG: hypothetical protein L6R40_003783 [Xanthomendoza cf. fulva]